MSMFSQQHYKVIARILRDETLDVFTDSLTLDRVYDKFVEVFKADNDRFDESKFYSTVWE